MLDLGWPELFVIMAVAVLVIGPNEIPSIMRLLGRFVRRLQYIKYAFSQQFEEFMQEQDLDDIRNCDDCRVAIENPQGQIFIG